MTTPPSRTDSELQQTDVRTEAESRSAIALDASAPGTSALSEFRRGYPLILGAMIGTGVGVASLPFYTAGAFMIPLEQAMGWSRTDLSIGLSASTLMLVLGAPVSGRLADRFGTRPVTIVSLLLLALGFLALSRLQGQAWIYIVAMGAISLLSAGSSPVTFTRAVNLAFDRGRGLALGLSLMGMGVAGALGPAFTESLISTGGWRAGYVGLAVVVAIAIVPVALLVSDRRQVASSVPVASANAMNAATAGKPSRDPKFWMVGAAFFLIALGQSGPISHFIPMLVDSGTSAADAAKAAGAIGVSVIVGRLVTGMALDRFFAPAVAIAVFSVTGLACLAAGIGGGHWALAVAPLLGFSLGADVDFLAYLTARYFRLSAYGETYGFLYSAFSVGAAAGPILYGAVHDQTGTYAPSLIGSSILFGAACVALGLLGPYPKTMR